MGGDRGRAADGGDARRRLGLFAIKAVHTAIFAAVATCIGWFVFAGATGRSDRRAAVALAVVAAEATVFVVNRGVCPLTPLAEELGAERGTVSDIFLPDVVARTLPAWSSALVAGGVVLHARTIHRRRQAGAPEG